MTILDILVLAIVLAVAWAIWKYLVLPNLPAALAFLRWLVPLLVGVLLVFYLLDHVGLLAILRTKIF